MARIILVRHGQASFGAANYDCLSTTGTQQAEHLGKLLRERGEKIDTFWAGTMKRHQQTISGLRQGGNWHCEQRPLANLNEFDHQQVIARYEPRFTDHRMMMEVLTSAEDPKNSFANMFGAALARWYGGAADSDYDEPWSQFQLRCRSALEHVADQIKSDETHLVVTSGGVISVIAQALLGLSDAATMKVNWTLANAGMTTLQVNSRNESRLICLNEHSHFLGHYHHLLTWR